MEKEMSATRSRLEVLNLEQSQLRQDKEEYLKSKAQLELVIKDLEDVEKKDKSSKVFYLSSNKDNSHHSRTVEIH